MRFRRWFLLIPIILAAVLLTGVKVTYAQDGGDDDDRSPLDQQCLMCHADADPDTTTTFGNGDERAIQFDVEAYDNSKHGMENRVAGLSCYDCHGAYSFPHEGQWESPRDFRLELNEACVDCHAYEGGLTADSTHAMAMAQGNEQAAVCVDCHGYHDVSEPDVPRERISQTCGQCHTDIFEIYKNSVHGEALLEGSNPDVPTCIHCHGVHNIEDPTTNLFRLKSPDICGQCHADERLMRDYRISTNVFDSYVADFHGTTVTLFQEQAPNAEVNKAVCYDCHGVHNILAPEHPDSTVRAENLLATCQKCHPDATDDFPASWTKHYEPDREKYPIVYYVDLFYKFFIPGILGFFAVVLIPDAIRRIIGGGHDHDDDGHDEDEAAAAEDTGDTPDTTDEADTDPEENDSDDVDAE